MGESKQEDCTLNKLEKNKNVNIGMRSNH